MRRKSINAIRKNPKGGKHWKYTNKVIDEIIKKSLKNSSILLYRPKGWIQPLFQTHFALKSYYWRNVFEIMLSSENNPHTFSSILRIIQSEIPVYIRIISLLTHIIIDRIGLSEYEKLPKLPANLFFQSNFMGLAPFPVNSIFKYVDNITNNAVLNIVEYLNNTRGRKTRIKENIDGEFLIPIPFAEIGEYFDLCKKMQIKYKGCFLNEDKLNNTTIAIKNGGLMPFTEITPAYLSFLDNPLFNSEIIPDMVDFLKNVFSKYASPETIIKVERICDFFYNFFKNIPTHLNKGASQHFVILENDLVLNDKDLETFLGFKYNTARSNVNLNDPLNCKELFKHSLDLFTTPFLQTRDGFVYFSLFWLFDALINHLTTKMRKYEFGNKRGLKAENYIGYLIFRELQDEKYKKDLTGPFKIIISNSNTQSLSPNYYKLKKNIVQFKYPVKEISLGVDEFGENFTYIEVDLAVIVKETLILIEVKDDLFWDIRDLPTLICLWNDNETKKLEKIGDKFEMEIIKERMNSVNLKYSSVKTILLTQSHITHTDFKTISNLLSLIEKIMVGDENLMIFTFLQNGFFPKYPWAD